MTKYLRSFIHTLFTIICDELETILQDPPVILKRNLENNNNSSFISKIKFLTTHWCVIRLSTLWHVYAHSQFSHKLLYV